MAFDYFKPKYTGSAFNLAKISGSFTETGFYSDKDGIVDERLLFDTLIRAAQFIPLAKPSEANPLTKPLFDDGGIKITEAFLLEDFHYRQYIQDSSNWRIPPLNEVNKGNDGNTAIDPFLVARPSTKVNRTFTIHINRRTPGDVSTRPLYGVQISIANRITNYILLLKYTDEGISESTNEDGTDALDSIVIAKNFDYVLNKFVDESAEQALPAVVIYTSQFEAFLTLAKSIALKPSADIDSYLERRYRFYAAAFRKAYDVEQIAASSNFELVHNFYQIIPEPCLRALSDDEMLLDLKKLLVFDAFSIFKDSGYVMLKILKNLSSPKVAYDFLRNEPSLTVEIFDQINGYEKTTEFCNFLTALSLIYQPVESPEQLPVVLMGGEYSLDKTNFFTDNGMVRITVYRSQQLYGGFSGDDEDPVKEVTIESKTFDQSFNPLDLVILRNAETGEEQVVCALYVQYLVELAVWKTIVDAIVITLNIISIFISAGLIVRGAIGLIRLFAAADIAISAIDIALQNQAFVDYLSQTETGKWFVENWTTLSMITLSGVMSIQLAENVIRRSDDFIRRLEEAKSQFPDLSLDEQIVVVKQWRRFADEIAEGAATIARGKYLGQALEKADFEAIRKYLARHQVELQIGPPSGIFDVDGFFMKSGNPVSLTPRNAAMFITDGLKMKMILRQNATVYEFFHEFMHFRHCQILGIKKYYDLGKDLIQGKIIRERYVYDKLIQHHKYLNSREIKHAEVYMNRYYEEFGITDNLGNPLKVELTDELKNIPVKRQTINIEKILLVR